MSEFYFKLNKIFFCRQWILNLSKFINLKYRIENEKKEKYYSIKQYLIKMLFKFKFKASKKEYENFKKIFSDSLLRKCNLKIYSFFHLNLKPKNLDIPSFTEKIINI